MAMARRRRPGAQRFLNAGGRLGARLPASSLLPRLRFQAARRPWACTPPTRRPPASAARKATGGPCARSSAGIRCLCGELTKSLSFLTWKTGIVITG